MLDPENVEQPPVVPRIFYGTPLGPNVAPQNKVTAVNYISYIIPCIRRFFLKSLKYNLECEMQIYYCSMNESYSYHLKQIMRIVAKVEQENSLRK